MVSELRESLSEEKTLEKCSKMKVREVPGAASSPGLFDSGCRVEVGVFSTARRCVSPRGLYRKQAASHGWTDWDCSKRYIVREFVQ